MADGVATSRRTVRLNRHFAANAWRRSRCQRRLRIVGATLERAERDGGGELGAANREAQAIAGDGIDEPGRIAREQQARNVAVDGIDGERPEDDRRCHQAARI